MVRQLALAGLALSSMAAAAPQQHASPKMARAASVTPVVKGTPQVLGVAMDPSLDRDSCGSSRFGSRSFWTCRDTQNFNSDGSVDSLPLYSSSASWGNYASSGGPALTSTPFFEGQDGLQLYGTNNDKPFYPILSEDCGDNTAGSCPDGTRYSIWPDSPPMVTSSSSNGDVTAYTWIRRFHIRSDLSQEQPDPPTTLYRVNYSLAGSNLGTLPAVTVVQPAFYAANEIAYGDYGNVMRDGTAYLWGKPSNNIVALARVPVGSVEDKSKYEYYVNGGWTGTAPSMSTSGAGLANAGAGGQGTFYYSDAWNSYVWIGQAGLSVSADFFITTAPAPEGPWTKPQHFYSGVNGNYSLGAYTLQAHPDLVPSGRNEIYLTYTKNDKVGSSNVYTTPLILVEWE